MLPKAPIALATVYAALASAATIDKSLIVRQQADNPASRNEVYLPLPGEVGTPPPDMATISQIKEYCDTSSSPEACMESANICAQRLLTNRRERLIPVHRIQACAKRNQATALDINNPASRNEVYLPLPGEVGTPPPDMATISQIKQHCDASSSPEACMESANICAKRLLTNRRERLIPIHRIQACADRIQKPPSAGEASTSASVSAAFKADIRVDTNRDGVVDVTGSSDEEGKNEWTNASGAIFLANIGDSNGRCKQTSAFQSPDTPLSQLIKCHDADDDEQRAPQFMAPMRTMPLPDLSNNATGSLVIGVEPARSQVRIFQSKGDKWQIVKDDTVISAEDLKQGLTLGVDSRSTRLPNGWDGHVSVDFIVKDGGSTSFDSVALRVAPVMIHHHKQAVNKLFSSTVRRAGEVGEAANKALDSLETSMPLERLPTPDVWAQDFFEPGYMSMPGPDGKPISLRIVLEGRRGKRDSQRLIYTQLRDTGVGAADPILRTRGYKETPIQATLQAGGNTESIPPYEFDGKKFPAGRIILGGEDADLPRQLEFYRAQEVQDPLVLDSMWLRVKHVDEMMQFLPSQTPQGFAMVAVDPELGLQKLREASKAGHGSQPIFSKTKVSSGPSIDEFLASKANIDATAEVGRRMNANIELIKKETGLADDAIFRMPMLVGLQEDVDAIVRLGKQRRRSIPRRQNQTEAEALDQELLVVLGIHGDEENDVLAADDGKVDFQLERRAGATPHMSYLPSMVNGVPLSDSHYMAPKPFGPEINGEDIFETAAKNLYQKVGFSRVDFHDTWVFHKAVGDIHCMTNTYRDTSDKWW